MDKTYTTRGHLDQRIIIMEPQLNHGIMK